MSHLNPDEIYLASGVVDPDREVSLEHAIGLIASGGVAEQRPSDQEVDASVAKLVFGWRVWVGTLDHAGEDLGRSPQSHEASGTGPIVVLTESSTGQLQPAPHFSTDPLADYSVLCHIRDRSWIEGDYWDRSPRDSNWLQFAALLPRPEDYAAGSYSLAALAVLGAAPMSITAWSRPAPVEPAPADIGPLSAVAPIHPPTNP